MLSPVPGIGLSNPRRNKRRTRPVLPRFLVGPSSRARLAATPASARVRLGETGLTVTGAPTIASDYLRGVSRTRSRPAAQFTGEVPPDGGSYVGGFGSNVAFLGTNARQEVDVLGGTRFDALGIKWDAGAIYDAYPGYGRPPGGFRLDYLEIAVKASRTFFDGATTLQASAFLPDYQSQSDRSLSVEGGVDRKPPFDVTLGARLGHLTIKRKERFGAPDYLNWSVGVPREVFAGFRLGIGYYDTNISRRECVPPGERTQDICGARVLVSLSRQF